MSFSRVKIVDSHTEGEPTRVVVSGGPDLGRGTVADQLAVFRDRFDRFRSAVCNEPRGSDALVGAILTPPRNPNAVTGVIYFNNVGYLNMCVHGTIGLGVTLAHLGKIGAGEHLVETPVGDVTITVGETSGGRDGSPSRTAGSPNRVRVSNVPSYRFAKDVPVELDGGRVVKGDVAWGGNWFFLVNDHGQTLTLRNVESLTEFCWRIRTALRGKVIEASGAVEGSPIRTLRGEEIDHIELFGPPTRPDCQSRNFVLCPGKAYDRSPCGTGTSAKLACLFADGKLAPGQVWRQESIIGTSFEGSVRVEGGRVIPTVSGEAYITAEGELLIDPADPLRDGIRA